MKTKVKSINIENLPLRQLRQRLFVKQSSTLYPESEYTFLDNVPDQIAKLPGFTNWESFSHTWDILWVGLDPRNLKWELGRHNSPVRKAVLPLRIVLLDERTKRMQINPEDREDIEKIEIPFKAPIYESEEDRAISKALSGKVVVDEPDDEKAKRMLVNNIEQLSQQLALLQDMAKKMK